MVKEGFKVGLQLYQVLVGGLLKLTGLALVSLPPVVGIAAKARAWMRLQALVVSKEVPPPPPPPLPPW